MSTHSQVAARRLAAVPYNMSASNDASAVAANPTAGSGDSFWGALEVAPPNAVFLTKDLFLADTDPRKVNLGIGAYRDDDGKPYVLKVVRKAEAKIAADMSLNHEYLPIGGLNSFNDKARTLMFGADSRAVADGRIASVQTISGTGSLGLAAAFLKKFRGESEIYLSSPTWGNHNAIFKQAGFKTIKTYRYWDAANRTLDINGQLADLQQAPSGSVVVMHACAHNPTGVDPTKAQWQQIAAVCQARGHLVYFDCAYQGFATGDLEADAQAIRYFVAQGVECIASQSFAKNFGLYNERIGGFHIVCKTAAIAKAVRSQLLLVIRALYSNPPVHGARIVDCVLGDAQLYAEWRAELKSMADRIITMRRALVAELKRLQTPGDWSHVTSQIGMFSFTGLNKAQCQRLKSHHHVYLLDNGRISMAGLNTKNVAYFAGCVDHVVRNIK
jgi:aspartate aminotransferase